MTLGDVNTRVNFYTGADTTAFSAADRLISLNTAIYDVDTEILRSQDAWDFDDKNNTNFPILTTSLIANQQDYSLPTEAIKITRSEITYDGTNWSKLNPTDINENSHPTDTTTIANDYSTDNPFYDLVGNSLFLNPIPSSNVTNGLKLWVQRLSTAFTSAEFTGGTKSLGFDTQFHEMIPIKMSLDYCLAKDMNRYNTLLLTWNTYIEKLRAFYNSRDKDTRYSLTSSNKNYN